MLARPNPAGFLYGGRMSPLFILFIALVATLLVLGYLI